MTNRRRPLSAFVILRVVGLGASAVVVVACSLFLDECIGFSMLKEVVVVVDAVEVEVLVVDAAVDDAWVGARVGVSRSSLVDGVVGVILMWISLFSVVVGGAVV